MMMMMMMIGSQLNNLIQVRVRERIEPNFSVSVRFVFALWLEYRNMSFLKLLIDLFIIDVSSNDQILPLTNIFSNNCYFSQVKSMVELDDTITALILPNL